MSGGRGMRLRGAPAAEHPPAGRPAAKRAARGACLRGAARRAAARAGGAAHPLGNFSINHLDDGQRVARPRRPSLRPRPGRDPHLPGAGNSRAECSHDKRRPRSRAARADRARPARSRSGLAGRAAQLPAGAGRPADDARGAAVCARRRPAPPPRRAPRRDVPGRVGWKAVVARPGEGTAVRSTAPSGRPDRGLRSYPKDVLSSPLRPRVGELLGRDRRRDAVAPREPGGRRRPRASARRRLRRAVRRRAPATARSPAPARGLRVGRGPRALAGARQGDGRRLPRRHARHARGTPSRSARPSRSPTRSASSPSAS